MFLVSSVLYNLRMEKITHNRWVLVWVGVIAVVATIFAVASRAVSFVERGLADSQKIRVVALSACVPAEGASDVRFVGCNSIL